MTSTFFNKILKKFSKNRRASSTAFLSCVSLFLVANASPIFAQDFGGMRTIRPTVVYDDTYQWSDVREILRDGVESDQEAAEEAGNEYSWAADLFFDKEIWQLEISYRPMRSVEVDFPNAKGQMDRKRVWYFVYSVTNTGKHYRNELDPAKSGSVEERITTIVSDDGTAEPTVAEKKYQIPSNNLDGVYRFKEVDYNGLKPDADGSVPGSVRFVPRFVFASSTIQDRLIYERDKKNGFYLGKTRGTQEGVYYDSYLPLAFAQIVQREGRGSQVFYDTVRMSTIDIKPGETVWGVATWVDVDPRIDRFSVYISGLTNALYWETPETNDGADEGFDGVRRDVFRKVLKLNFINPGDELHVGGKEIYNYLPGELDYQWIYL